MIPRPHKTLANLREQSAQRRLIDYEATRRALARQEALRQYQDWRNVGSAGNPAFSNGWSNATPNTAWEGFVSEARNPCGFFRDRWGFVHLRGYIGNAAINTNPVFTLPAELAPVIRSFGRSYYITEGTGGLAGVFFRYTCMCVAYPDGKVQIEAYYGTTGFNGVKMATLDGFHFEAANKGDPLA